MLYFIAFACAAGLVAFGLIVAAYLGLLAITRILAVGEGARPAAEPAHRFAILIPAHNEEETIVSTVESCRALDYPRELFDVLVVADNCDDRTEELALQAGASCLARHDAVLRGKGFALKWGLDHLLAEDYEAVVLLDADCRLDRHALRVYDSYLQAGAAVLQSNESAANPDESVISYALALGKFIENELYLTPKSTLGLPVYLQGKGMVLPTALLRSIPWDAYSVTEDTEYSIRLLERDVRVLFVREVSVHSDFPADRQQLTIQRSRWAGGNLEVAKLNAWRILTRGLRHGRWMLVDAGWSFLVGSRPIVLLEAGLTLVASAVCFGVWPGPFSAGLLAASLALVLFHIAYVVLGAMMMRLSPRRLTLLAAAPMVLLRMIGISMRALVGGGPRSWQKTPRRSVPAASEVAVGDGDRDLI